jgi:hypothetical protein
MKAINITAYTEDASQIEAIKAVIKAFKIKYKISKFQESESPYNPEFVAKIKKADKEFADGKGIKMSIAEFKELCK